MKHREDSSLIREALLSEPGTLAEAPDCLDDEALAGFVAASLDAGSRTAAMVHLAGCARCRSAVASLARALTDAPVAREIARVDSPGHRRLARILLPLGAAAALLLLVGRPRDTDTNGPAPVHREPTITAGTSPVLRSPSGAVVGVDSLRWGTVPDADRYRVTLFSGAGEVLYEVQLTDTVALFPDSILLLPGRPYLWKVEARTGFDRWTASELMEFTLRGTAPR